MHTINALTQFNQPCSSEPGSRSILSLGNYYLDTQTFMQQTTEPMTYYTYKHT